MAGISPSTYSGPYTANGSQTAFPFDFTANSAGEVSVQVDGATVSASLYSVALEDDFNSGTVTFLSAPATGSILYLIPNPDFQQASEFENEGAYKLSTVNTINRRAAARDLKLKGRLDRTPEIPLAGGVNGLFPYVNGAGGWSFTAAGPGATGATGTLAANSGFTSSGPSTVQGDSATIFRILNADASNSLKINSLAPFVSAAGTRTSKAPRITGGSGTDIGFDSFITSNATAVGTTLFRDEFQDTSTFSSLNGAHASFDAYCDFVGAGDRNHHRGFQARGKLSITGTGSGTAGLPLLSEWTGFFGCPIFAGTWQIDQLVSGLWVRDAQVDSGTPSVVHAYGVKIDTLTQGSGTIYGLYVENNDCYFGKNIQMRSNVIGQGDIYNVRQFRGLAAQVTGALVAFDAGGGMVLAGKSGAGDYATIYCHADATGATKRGLSVMTNNMVVGSDLPTSGKQLDVAGGIDATDAYYVDGVKVVGNRDTGWTAMTGTGSKGALAAAGAGTASVAYAQAELQGALNRIAALEARLKSLDAALVSHGIIGA